MLKFRPHCRITLPFLRFRSQSTQPYSHLNILRHLSKHLWPRNNTKTKLRVASAVALLVAAKCLNVTIPFFFKEAVNVLSTASQSVDVLHVAGSVVLGYGAARLGAVLFQEIRNGKYCNVHRIMLNHMNIVVVS